MADAHLIDLLRSIYNLNILDLNILDLIIIDLIIIDINIDINQRT